MKLRNKISRLPYLINQRDSIKINNNNTITVPPSFQQYQEHYRERLPSIGESELRTGTTHVISPVSLSRHVD